MRTRTKIVCTLGPAVDSRAKLKSLIRAGMNVARINCAHGDWPTRRRWIQWIRELSPEMGPIGVLVDLQGPKFRLGEIAEGQIHVRAGERLTLGKGGLIPIHQAEILESFAPGLRVLVADGALQLRLKERVEEGQFEAVALTSGVASSRQGVTLAGHRFHTPAFTERDRLDAQEAVRSGADFIALSYIQQATDLGDLREAIRTVGGSAFVCAKIETRDALDHLVSIVESADVVMVARGDLGLQIDLEDVPLWQKRIIQACRFAGKPVITATQMLESMIAAPRPTRAEAADIANAVLDGTDALMLSGETATGQYPIQAVQTMARIAHRAETLLFKEPLRYAVTQPPAYRWEPTDSVAHAAVELSQALRRKAIVTTSTSGQTARLVSKFRPSAPILCATYRPETHLYLSVVWGVEAIRFDPPRSTDQSVQTAIEGFVRNRRLKSGDSVVITAGVPAGVAGQTNMILIQVVP